jgi:hypothetical protein
MHVNGLIYAQLTEDEDPDCAARFRDRAGQFSQEYVHWFSSERSGIPSQLGISITRKK